MSTDEEVTNSDTEPSKDDLRERVRQLEQQLDAVTPDDVSRRAVLTGGGVGLASLLGGYYTGRAEAGSQSAGQIGTEANPADFWSEDNYIKSQSGDPAAPSSTNDVVFYNKSGSLYKRDGSGTVSSLGGVQNPMQADLDADGHNITNLGQVGMGAWPDEGQLKLYVRNSGSDSNTGLSSGDALATIQEAITRIPRLARENGDIAAVAIELGGGETYTASDEVVRVPWVNRLTITSSGTSTIEVPSGSDGFLVRRSAVQLYNVTIQPTDTLNPHDSAITATRQSTVELRSGTTITGGLGGGGNGLVQAYESSHIRMVSGPTIDGDGDGAHGIVVHGGSHASVNGTVQNCDRGVFLDRLGTADCISQTIDNCTYGLYASDGGTGKLSSGSCTNCTTGLYAVRAGAVLYESSTDFTGTSTVHSEDDGGFYYDLVNDDTYIGNSSSVYVGDTVEIDQGVGVRITDTIPYLMLNDTDGGRLQIGLNGTTATFRDDAGTPRMSLDLTTGDVVLDGSLTENGSP